MGAEILRGFLRWPRRRGARLLLFTALLLIATAQFANAAPTYRCSFTQDLGLPSIARRDGKKTLGRVVWTDPLLTSRMKQLKKQLKKARSGAVKKTVQKNTKIVQSLGKTLRGCPQTLPTPATVSFADVAPILQARCLSCHATEGNWQNSEAWYVASGRVVAANLQSSTLYSYLSNNPDNLSPGYMPRGLSPLPAKDIQLIRQWILTMNPQQVPLPQTQFEFACTNASIPQAAPLKRLARHQFINTFLDLLSPFSGPEQSQIFTIVSTALNTIPADSPQKSVLEERAFLGTDLSVTPQHISAIYSAALSFATQVTLTPARQATFSLNNCSFGSSGAARTCLNNFVLQFGARILRRPLSTQEQTNYANYYLSRPSTTAFRDLIVTMFMEPDFFYLREDRGTSEQVEGVDALRLTGYELASRLSYQFWQSMPDASLFAAAANGSLLTEPGYRAQVDRLFSSARTKRTVDQFFEELLGTNQATVFNAVNAPQFNSFAAGLSIPAGSSELSENMRQEMIDLVDHYVWQTGQNFSDLFLSSYSFARDPTLATIYGVQPWNGSHQALVPFPSADQNRGLLGRAAIQATGSHLKSTAKLGARILREWNCNTLEDPPPALMNQIQAPAYDPTKSTRQRYEDLTAPVACIGCHTQINPVGFALERIDALGRYRDVEQIFNQNGQQIAALPINSTVEFRSLPTTPRTVSTPIEVFRAMIDSGKAQACFAQQYFRFSYRVHEDLQTNGCILQRLHHELKREDGSLQGMFKEIVLSTDYRMRRISP